MSTTGNVALILGSEEKNETVKSRLETSLDNYNYIPFTSLMKALEYSRSENKDFDRLIIFENRLANSKGVVRGDDDPRVDAIKNLNDYVLDGRGDTEIVLICTTDKPTGIHKAFVEVLENPYATPVLVEKSTVSLMKELVSRDIDSLRASYYDLDYARVEKLIVEPEEEEVEKTETKSSSISDKKSKLLSLFGKKNTSTHSSGVLESAGKVAESLGSGAGDVEAAKESQYQSSEIEEDDDDDEFAGPAGDLGYSSASDSDPEDMNDDDDIGASLDFSSAGANHEVTGLFDEDDDDDDKSVKSDDSEGYDDSYEEGYEENYDDYYHDDVESVEPEGTGLIEESGNFESSYEDYDSVSAHPTQAMPVVDQYEYDDEDYNREYEAEEYDEPYDYEYDEEYEDEEEDELPVIRERIVVVTGIRRNGLTNTTATYGTKFITDNNRVLLVDADFATSGMVGYVSDINDFMSNDHSILSGNPYTEGGLDILSNGYNTEMTTEDIEWINDSRNYAEYGRVVIDCPLEFLDNIRPLLKHAGIVVMVDGNPTGMINMVRAFNDRFMVPDELALLIHKRGTYCTIRKEDDFEEVLENLKNTLVFDRVNWLAGIA